MGEVYLARSPSGALRAYKILRADALQGPQAAARFSREVTLLGRLKHPGIVQILQTGQFEGGLYLAMEYVDGPDLQGAVDKHGPFSVADALKILIQLAEALAFAHHQQVVHRDLAPEQSSASAVGPEADSYALGGGAYFALTGTPLFAPRSAVAMIYAHVHETPEPLAVRAPDLELPAGLEELLAAGALA